MDEIEFLSFEGILKNIEVLKTRYQGFLSPFFNVKMIRCWRTMIFSLPIEYWKRERLWEVLNYDEDVELLYKLI